MYISFVELKESYLLSFLSVLLAEKYTLQKCLTLNFYKKSHLIRIEYIEKVSIRP
jgi:hypothetical protein